MSSPAEEAARALLQIARTALDAALEVGDGKYGIVLAKARTLHELVSDAVSQVRAAIDSPAQPVDASPREG